jgi:alpha-tubulin suppressor-like RCC1 family protein
MGQIGNGKSGTGFIDSIPVKIMDDVVCASAGYKSSFAIKNYGSLWAWGENSSGQLGIGTGSTSSHVDLPVKIMDNVSFVEAGDDYTMIIKTDKTLWACGNNKNGQFGNGTQQSSAVPVYITDNVRSVSAGACHTVIIKTNGRLYSCGDNTSSQLGDATSLSKNSFVPVILNAFK